MAFTRRKFLQTGAVVTLGAGLPMKALADTLSPSISHSNTSRANALLAGAGSHFDMQTFSNQLNTYFRFSHATVKNATLKLVEITDWLTKPTEKTGRECFSLIFSGAESSSLAQNTYTVQHSSLGTFSMLLVPKGTANGIGYYEAVFNRFI